MGEIYIYITYFRENVKTWGGCRWEDNIKVNNLKN